MKFKSTTTSWDVLSSAHITENVHYNKNGTIALFDISTERKDSLCPAQGKVIRDCINNFQSRIVSMADLPLVAEAEDEPDSILSTKMRDYLSSNNTTLQEMYNKYLQGIVDTAPGYCHDVLDKMYM